MIAYLIYENGQFHVKKTSGYKPDNSVAIIPENISKNDYPYLYGEQVDDGEGNLVWQVAIDNIAKGVAISKIDIASQKTALHTAYIDDINTEMVSIFGTTDRDKASAMYNTWKEWKDDPSFFADKGLFDEFGAALDTAAKIATYANQKLSQTKQYSVFLMTREKQFRDAVALLGG